ncbi:MAG: FtsL-like putative cell division protein [Prevotella sp.]|nr:FtsL-like putative cell division protein [Prevotella sp.]
MKPTDKNLPDALLEAAMPEDKPETAGKPADMPAVEKQADEEEVPSLKEVIEETAREDEQPQSTKLTLREILGGDILYTKQVRQQIWLILIISVFAVLYVGNRYSCQKSLIEIDRLNTILQKSKYKALSISSELTEVCRESNVLGHLKECQDSTLKIASQPPYIIKVPEK